MIKPIAIDLELVSQAVIMQRSGPFIFEPLNTDGSPTGCQTFVPIKIIVEVIFRVQSDFILATITVSDFEIGLHPQLESKHRVIEILFLTWIRCNRKWLCSSPSTDCSAFRFNLDYL